MLARCCAHRIAIAELQKFSRICNSPMTTQSIRMDDTIRNKYHVNERTGPVAIKKRRGWHRRRKRFSVAYKTARRESVMVRGLREPLRAYTSARKSIHLCGVAAFAALVFTTLTANAQDSRPIKTARNDPRAVQSMGDQINQNTIAIMSGNPNGTYLKMAYDLSAVLDDGDNFRVLPVIGKGGGQNLRDVRFLKGIDLGITQSNLMNRMRRTNEIGTLDDKIVYIAKLYNEEMHFIVRADSNIKTLEDLNGKTVNFSDIGSGTQLSTHDIFEKLNI